VDRRRSGGFFHRESKVKLRPLPQNSRAELDNRGW
jgi:hypothetical protein